MVQNQTSNTIIERKLRGKTVEINISNLIWNVRIIKSRLEKGSKLFPVVKSNAYGHGIENIVPHIDNMVDGWCVANSEEALITRRFSNKPVIILKGTHDETETKEACKNGFFIVVRDSQDLKRKMKEDAKNLFLKVDTGMGRLGILPDELETIADMLVDCKDKIEGIITHFAYSDFGSLEFVISQKKIFDEICDKLENTLGKKLIKTISNSAGTLIGKELDLHKDIVRPGICLYGISPFDETTDFSLKPVMSVKSQVLTVKEIPKGWTVGYSRRFIAGDKIKIAIIDVGYADGIPRKLWEEGFVSIKNKRYKLIGVISMDMMCAICDDEVKVGDEAYIIGNGITAYEIAKKTNTIPYEIICSMGLK